MKPWHPLGIDAVAVEVGMKVDISSGLPYFAMVVSPDNIVRENKDQGQDSAVRNSSSLYLRAIMSRIPAITWKLEPLSAI